MLLKKIYPNYTIRVTKKTPIKVESKTFKLYSEKEPINVLKNIKTKLCATYDSNNVVVVTFIDENKKVVGSESFPYHDFDIIRLSTKIKNQLKEIEGIIDSKATRYRISVQNSSSPQFDIKYFTFNSTGDFKDIYMNLKLFFEEKEIDSEREEFIFENKKQKKSTHYINLSMCGTTERLSKPSKSFKIFIPNHSSGQIIEMLGGKEDEQ